MLRRLRLRYEQSLQGVVQLELGLVLRPAAVQNAVGLSLRLPNLPESSLPAGTTIVQAYEHAQQELLILGEPGAGKSTFLVALAQHLVEQAEHDTTQLLPLIVPLSTWATKRGPLHTWLAEQIALIYDIPRVLIQQWVDAGFVLPLLDGLDEMEEAARADCIAAINAYHRDALHALQPLVVCSRTDEYQRASQRERLALHAAMILQPLSLTQIKNRLVAVGKPMAALRKALQQNATLQELATTPLMLQALILTYHDVPIKAFPQEAVRLQQQVWTDYIAHMVECKGNAKRYPLPQIIAWLHWLAQRMREQDQTIFYLEFLQVDWLPHEKSLFYPWSLGLCGGLVVGLFFGLLVSLVGGLLSGLVFGLVFWLLSGLVIVLSLLVKRAAKIQVVETFTWSWQAVRGILFFWLFIGLISGLLFGLHGGLVFGLRVGPLGGLFSGLFGGLLVGVLHGLVGGLKIHQLIDRSRFSPNEGVRRSITNGLVIGLVVGLLSGLSGGLLGALFGELVFWRRNMPIGVLLVGLPFGSSSELVAELAFGLLGALLSGLVGSLVGGLAGGLDAAIQHYTLRFQLWQSHLFPLKAVSFLEDATARILLKRVGSGYSFIHRQLLDYFADLEKPLSAAPSDTLSPPPPAV